mgnify:CR=1 FL=1
MTLFHTCFHFAENEARYVNSVCLDFLNGLNGDYAQSVSRKLDEVKRELTPAELAAVQQSVISATIEFIDHLPLIPNFDTRKPDDTAAAAAAVAAAAAEDQDEDQDDPQAIAAAPTIVTTAHS